MTSRSPILGTRPIVITTILTILGGTWDEHDGPIANSCDVTNGLYTSAKSTTASS
ncbi:hypothetical protein ACL9RL_16760 [Plantibacter sp. Mn2098]|uniref:hypothetical protein n=1 Tax=Plantibacter sp. Mn2098 TaxID=3395266 RepID=UPI003BDCEBD9